MMPDAHIIKPDVSLNEMLFWRIELSSVLDILDCRRSDGSVIQLEPEQQKVLARKLSYTLQAISEILDDTLEAEDRARNDGYNKAEAYCAGVHA